MRCINYEEKMAMLWGLPQWGGQWKCFVKLTLCPCGIPMQVDFSSNENGMGLGLSFKPT